MISFPGVSSLETPRSAWSRGRQPQGRGSRRSPSGSGCPRGSRPLPALLCPPFPAGRSGNPEMEVPSPAGGACSRGRLQVPSTSPPAARRPSAPGAASVLAPWGSPRLVSVQAGAGRTCPGVFGKPMGANTHLVERGQVESGVCLAARVGRGLFAAPPCLCASFCA